MLGLIIGLAIGAALGTAVPVGGGRAAARPGRGGGEPGPAAARARVDLRGLNVASPIVGASRPEQEEQNAAAAGVRLSDDTLRAVDEALADVVQR